MPFRAAILGCGGRGREHAAGFAASPDVTIVACADPVRASAEKLAEARHVANVYEDYRILLAETHPDIVSVCTWPHLHREMVEAAVAAGARAIHCEKPMAPTYGDSKAMHRACEEAGVLLTLCHQRRFGPEFRAVRDRLVAGDIGTILRMEGRCNNLYDWGTHWFDMFHFFNGDRNVLWVLGQIDVAVDRKVFGVPVESSGISLAAWENGVFSTLYTGRESEAPKISTLFGSEGLVVHGTSGRMDVGHRRLRVSIPGQAPEDVPLEAIESDTTLSCLDLVASLQSGEEPELSSRKAIKATELIFATYESARRRGRVTLPLEIEDSPLIRGLAEGIWKPAG